MPCDTPTSPPSAIAEWRNGLLSSFDFSTLSPDYASKQGLFAPENVTERAKQVRTFLRDRPEEEIVGGSPFFLFDASRFHGVHQGCSPSLCERHCAKPVDPSIRLSHEHVIEGPRIQ